MILRGSYMGRNDSLLAQYGQAYIIGEVREWVFRFSGVLDPELCCYAQVPSVALE